MKEYLRIGEVSKLYGISLDTLRHYDSLGILKPYVDEHNGYRYYSLEHLDNLEIILLSKEMRTPLKELNEVLESEDLFKYEEMYKLQKERVEQEIRKLNTLNEYNNQVIDLIKEMKNFENDYTYKRIIRSEYSLNLYEYRIEDLNSLSAYESDLFEVLDQMYLSTEKWSSHQLKSGPLFL